MQLHNKIQTSGVFNQHKQQYQKSQPWLSSFTQTLKPELLKTFCNHQTQRKVSLIAA